MIAMHGLSAGEDEAATPDERATLHHAHGCSLSVLIGPCCDTSHLGCIFNPVGDAPEFWDTVVVRNEFRRKASAFTYTETAGAH